MFPEKKIDTGQVTINYAEGPPSGVPLVLLHGATARWQSWGPFLSQLEPLGHIYACDLRGHGKSGRVPSGYRAVDYIPDTTAFIQQVIGKPAILLGLSLGGIIAPGVAAQIPELMRAVILLDPGFFLRDTTVKNFGWPYDYFLSVRDILLGSRSVEEVIAALGWEMDETEIQDFSEQIHSVDLDSVTVFLNDQFMDGFNLKQAVQKITCPTLLLYGEIEKGAVVRESEVDFFHTYAPNGVSIQIKEAGHMLFVDQPALVLNHITQFLSAI